MPQWLVDFGSIIFSSSLARGDMAMSVILEWDDISSATSVILIPVELRSAFRHWRFLHSTFFFLGSASLPSAVKVIPPWHNLISHVTVTPSWMRLVEVPHILMLCVCCHASVLWGYMLAPFVSWSDSADFATPSNLQLPFHRKNYMNFI